MSVDTKAVQGRRKLHFESLDEIVADAQRLVDSPNTKMLGNWPLERILSHLTMALNRSVDGFNAKAPIFIRLIGRFVKSGILRKGMPAGRMLPKEVVVSFYPEVPSTQHAMRNLAAAVQRVGKEQMTANHPVFGKMTHEEWRQLHLRHSELHLSFAVPG